MRIACFLDDGLGIELEFSNSEGQRKICYKWRKFRWETTKIFTETGISINVNKGCLYVSEDRISNLLETVDYITNNPHISEWTFAIAASQIISIKFVLGTQLKARFTYQCIDSRAYWDKKFDINNYIKRVKVFHSMLAAYAILVPTLYGNRKTRFHGLRQHGMAGWKFYLFIKCPTRSLTGCWVECRATFSSLVSANFHCKGRITLYIFWREGPDIAQNFFLCNVVWSLSDNSIGFWSTQCCPKSIKATWNRIFSFAMLTGASRSTLHRILPCAM